MVGINGSGKTTNSAKIAHYYALQNEAVLLGAADTFRAAGSSQLSLWGDRLRIPVVTGEKGADPGSVVFNTMNSFVQKQYDRVIIDTAGRVQTRDQLMKELEKLVKIITKFHESGPDEVLLVVDGTMGQNTLDQARRFKDFSGLTGLVLTKVDGTTKGGTVVNIVDEMQVPIRFLGVGESAEDLLVFEPSAFIDRLLAS
jgi:fused signal recognition particle receptor